MKIFIICSVREASDDYRKKLEAHVASLESAGHKVHLPHRDTDQDGAGIDICFQNMRAINDADVIHIFYSGKSQGTHFDMGMAFAMGKALIVIESDPPYGTSGKSFPLMLKEWEHLYECYGEKLK